MFSLDIVQHDSVFLCDCWKQCPALTLTLLKTGVAFPIPKDAAIWINCSLEIASVTFIICNAENKKALVGNFDQHLLLSRELICQVQLMVRK
jgi:hypothetical protein